MSSVASHASRYLLFLILALLFILPFNHLHHQWIHPSSPSSFIQARELYFGPNSNQICASPSSSSSNSTKFYFDTWCEHVNPFASTPQPLAEISIFNESFSMECMDSNHSQQILSHSNNDDNSLTANDDSQLQECYGVMGVVALGDDGLVKAFRNGRVIQVSKASPYNQRELYYKPRDEPTILFVDSLPKIANSVHSFSFDYVALIQKGNVNDRGRKQTTLKLVILDDFKSVFPASWSYNLDEDVVEVVQLKMMRDFRNKNTYAVMLLKYSTHYKIIFVDCYTYRLATSWFVYPADSNSSWIRIDISTQFGDFTYNAAMKIHPYNLYNSAYYGRSLVTIYSEQEVRVYEFQKTGKNIYFKFQDLLTTFYRVQDSNTVITHASLIPEWIRRPLSMSMTTRCYSVEFPYSQNMFLGLGLKRKSTSWNSAVNYSYQFLLHHIQEFSEYRSMSSSNTNTAGRWYNFNCNPNQYWDSSTCRNNIEQVVHLNEELVSMTSRLSDITTTVNGQTSYDVLGRLIPSIICQLPYLGNGTPPNQALCLRDAQQMQCESSIFNSFTDSRNLYTFFYNYWHTQLFLQTNKKMIIYAMTIQLSNSTQGETILKQVNSMTLPGKIIHTFNSLNNQHLLLSMTRQKWEILAEKRYQLVCDTLRNDPDNVFLKNFKDQCVLSPPKPFDENHFAMIVNSCLDGHLCSDFSMNSISEDVAPGMFVDRSIYVTTCPLGSFCIKGIKIPCPYGYVCSSLGLTFPEKCSSSSNMESCYREGLSNPFSCPNGTLCTTNYLRPIPASPGHFVKKIKFKNSTISLVGLTMCENGDYCNLGREVIVEERQPFNYSSLLCPQDTYCLNNSILQPSFCEFNNDTIDYCPNGTIFKRPCPKGFYCENTHTIAACESTQYCPEGSITYQLCPKGYYCPNATVKIICPVGYFCAPGSIRPSECSWFLSLCPEGSSTDQMTVGGLILFGSILFLIFMINVIYEIAFKLYVKISAKLRKKRRELGEKSSLFSAKQRRDLMTSSMATASFVQDNFTVDIGFENLGLILRGSGKKVLHGVTGEIKHGQLTAVMGLSGCGKSTFITTLANRAYYGTQVGKVFVNGVEEKLSNYNRRIGFVPQDDIMIPTMTVEETLYFSARTRLDAKKSKKDIDAIVNDVIKVLNLEDVRHSVIGDQEKRGISGGQRKRVNVGIELVSSPLVLFLDEPTSGLDSASSKEVCEALQNISRAGINVITVIHQPRYEIFTMFDTLLLLGKGGRTIYLGPVDRVEEYFEKEFEFVKPNGINLADFVIDISAGMVENEKHPNFDPHSLPEYWEERKHKYDTNARASLGIGGFLDRDNTTSTPLVNPSSMSTSVNSTSTTGNALNYYMTKPPQIMTPTPRSKRKFINPRLPYFAQFWMCFKRSIVQLLRGLPSLVLDFSLIFLCASFLGLLFYNKVYVGPPPSNVYEKCPGDLQKVCKQPADDPIATISALMSLSMALMGSMAALRVFGKEYLNFYRESQTGLSTFCYFWAKDMSMLIVNIFAPIVFLTIYYTTVAPLASVLEYYYALLLVYWASYGLGYFISIIVKPNVAQLTSVVIVFIFNVFSGSTTPLPTLRDMYFPINIFPALSYLTYSHENIYLIELERYRHLYNTTTSMENMGYKWDELGLTIGMVVVFGMLFRIASFVALVCVKPSSLFNLAMFSIQNFFLNKVRAIMKKFRKQ